MTWKISGRRKPGGARRPRIDVGIGPELTFAGATLASVAAWGAAKQTLQPDLVMPAITTLILVFAACSAVLAWRNRDENPTRVTYADVAGALTLIGLFATSTIDPDQLVRIVANGRSQD